MSNQSTKVRLVTVNGAQTFDTADVIAAMEVRGYEFTSLNNNKWHRQELQGQPKFAGLCGPMFDGDAIRYECADTNRALSA